MKLLIPNPPRLQAARGVRIHGTGQPAKESTPQTLDVYAVSDGKVLYLFTLRNHADNYKKNVEVFQKSVATAKLSARQHRDCKLSRAGGIWWLGKSC